MQFLILYNNINNNIYVMSYPDYYRNFLRLLITCKFIKFRRIQGISLSNSQKSHTTEFHATSSHLMVTMRCSRCVNARTNLVFYSLMFSLTFLFVFLLLSMSCFPLLIPHLSISHCFFY